MGKKNLTCVYKLISLMILIVIVTIINGSVSYAADEKYIDLNTTTNVFSPGWNGNYQYNEDDLELIDEEGIYYFILPKQGKISVKAQGIFYLYGFEICEIDEEGNEIVLGERKAGTDEIYELVSNPLRLNAGKYMVRMKTYSDALIALTVEFEEESPSVAETEKNNSFNTANVIELNKEYKANLNSYDDVDYYSFELKQEGSIFVYLRNNKAYEKRWTVELYNKDVDGNKNLIETSQNTTEKVTRFKKYRLPKGVYFIKVSYGKPVIAGDYNVTDDYKIGTEYVPETKEDYEIEYNDTVENANVISVNKEYIGNIPTTEDIDYYSFDLENESKLSIKLMQEKDEITKFLYMVTLYRVNEDGKLVIHGSYLTGDKAVSESDVVFLPKGQYIISVCNNNEKPEDKDDYVLKICQEESSLGVIINDTPTDVEGEAGTPVAVNSTIVFKKDDRFIFNLKKRGRISLSAIPYKYGNDTIDDFKFSNYDEIGLYKTDKDGNEIELCSDKQNASESKEKFETREQILDPGRYIIKIDLNPLKKLKASLTIKYEELPDLAESEIGIINDQIYSGEAITPKPTVKFKGKTLVENKDYRISYANNINAGTATVTINSIKDYSEGTNKTTFKINKREISVPVSIQSEFVFDYTEKQIQIEHDDISYLKTQNDKATNAGSYKAIYSIDYDNCNWEGNRTENVELEWTIKKAPADITVKTQSYEKYMTDASFALDGIESDSDGKIVFTVIQGADVINVDDTGLVTILKPGTAIVGVKANETANYNESIEKKIEIIIKKAPADITVKTQSYEKYITDTSFALDGIESDSDGKIVFTVIQGADVINVDDTGLVTILKPGTAIISVKANETAKYTKSVEKKLEVIIKKAPADINVKTQSYKKNVDDASFVLDGIESGSDGKIVFTVVQGADVINVDGTGLVTILKPGTAIISVKANETAKYTESVEKRIEIIIKELPVGAEVKTDSGYYEVSSSGDAIKTVTFVESDNIVATYTIPSTIISESGETYVVTAIGEKAFYNNKKLKKVIIPATVTSIDKNAFEGCSNLTTINIASGVKRIGTNAFSNCKKLTSIILPKTVTKIEKNTFNGCKKLKTITIKSDKVINVEDNAFKGVSNKCVIKVPRKLVKKYKKLLTKKKGFKKGMKIKKI